MSSDIFGYDESNAESIDIFDEIENVCDYDSTNIEITDYTDLDDDVKTIIVTSVAETVFLNLVGGTTGQVLSKHSNQDGDFTWVNVVNTIEKEVVSVDDEPYVGAKVGDIYLDVTYNTNNHLYIPLIMTYDGLTNKPIVNQDLSSLTFVPVSGTYYRHVGLTDGTYVNGVIYFYDGTDFSAITTVKELSTKLTDYYTKLQIDSITAVINANINSIAGLLSPQASAQNPVMDKAWIENYVNSAVILQAPMVYDYTV